MCRTRSAEKRLKLEAWLEKKKERESSLHRAQQQPVSEPTGTNNDELSGNGTEFRINKRKSLAESIEIASPGTEALLLAGTVCSRDLETGAKNLSRQFNAAADMEPSVCPEALSKNVSSVVAGENFDAVDSTAEPTKEFSTAACPEFSFGGSPASLENETPVAENETLLHTPLAICQISMLILTFVAFSQTRSEMQPQALNQLVFQTRYNYVRNTNSNCKKPPACKSGNKTWNCCTATFAMSMRSCWI